MRLLCLHRLAAVLVDDEPLNRIRDKPGAIVLKQMALVLPPRPYRPR